MRRLRAALLTCPAVRNSIKLGNLKKTISWHGRLVTCPLCKSLPNCFGTLDLSPPPKPPARRPAKQKQPSPKSITNKSTPPLPETQNPVQGATASKISAPSASPREANSTLQRAADKFKRTRAEIRFREAPPSSSPARVTDSPIQILSRQRPYLFFRCLAPLRICLQVVTKPVRLFSRFAASLFSRPKPPLTEISLQNRAA
jgi:hypothetical protein